MKFIQSESKAHMKSSVQSFQPIRCLDDDVTFLSISIQSQGTAMAWLQGIICII